MERTKVVINKCTVPLIHRNGAIFNFIVAVIVAKIKRGLN